MELFGLYSVCNNKSEEVVKIWECLICGTGLNQYVILVNPIDLMLCQSKARHQLAPWTSFMNHLSKNTSGYWHSFKISNKWSSLHNWHLKMYFKHLTEQGLRPAVQWHAGKHDSWPSLKHILPKTKGKSQRRWEYVVSGRSNRGYSCTPNKGIITEANLLQHTELHWWRWCVISPWGDIKNFVFNIFHHKELFYRKVKRENKFILCLGWQNSFLHF